MIKVPELRFDGFEGEWEEKKISKIAKINPKSSPLPEKFKYVDLTSVSGTSLINFDIINKKEAPSRAQRVAKKGDIFYQTVRPYQKNNLFFDLDDTDFIFSTGYAQIRTTNNNSRYLFTLIQTKRFVDTVMNRTTGTSFPAISTSELSDINVKIPRNISEQEKIGDLFKKIDALIEIQEDKVAKMEDFKKSMLQKMFPKKGKLVPEFRFEGFDGELNSFRINELIEYSNGNTLEPLITENGDLEVLNLNSVSINGQLKGTSKYINSPYSTLEKNDIIMILSDIAHGNLIGKTAVIPESNKYVLNQRVAQLKPKNIDSYFLSYYINHNQKDLYALSAGTSQLNLSKTEILKYYVRIPALEEQQKIGKFFKNLDTQIENEEKLLDSYKIMKKSLLQKMFV